MKVNPTIMFVVAAIFGALTLIGVVVLNALHDNSTIFVGFAGALITLVLGFGSNQAGTTSQTTMLQQQAQALADAISQVELKVNGTLTQALNLATQNNAPTSDIAQIAAATGVAPTAPSAPPAPAPAPAATAPAVAPAPAPAQVSTIDPAVLPHV